MRRYSKPLSPTKPRRKYRLVHTTLQETQQWAAQDREKALQHLLRLQNLGILNEAQQSQLDRLLLELPPET